MRAAFARAEAILQMRNGRTRLRRIHVSARYIADLWLFGLAPECAIGRVMDLVNVTIPNIVTRKRCDLPGQNLIQLESLILAQSERWRQA